MKFDAHTAEVTSAIFSASENHILTTGRDNCIKLWDMRT